MRGLNSPPTKILGLALRPLGATTTFADDMVDVRVDNDTAEEIVGTELRCATKSCIETASIAFRPNTAVGQRHRSANPSQHTRFRWEAGDVGNSYRFTPISRRRLFAERPIVPLNVFFRMR